MTFGSVFAGIGGFDLGFERAGMVCRWQIENDRQCNEILTLRWPDIPRFGDVTKVTGEQLEPVQVMCGGFPCQGLSVAGKRRGLADERSALFWEFVRLASELRPSWLVLENVPGLLSSNDGRDMGAVIGGLENAGFSCAWRVLDSQWFGVAQRRRRVFIVGHSDAHRAGAVLFEPEGGAGDSAPMRETGKDIAHALDARSGGVSAEAGTLVAHALNAHGGSCGRIDGESETFVSSPSDPNRVRTAPGLSRWLDEHLPEGHDGKRYRMLGNAVTVPVAEWIGRRIMRIEAAND